MEHKWMELKWMDGFEVAVEIKGDEVVLSANKEGLLSLANHLIALSEQDPGAHIHFDKYNSLEEGSSELIVVLK